MEKKFNFNEKFLSYSKGNGQYIIEEISSVSDKTIYQITKRFFDIIIAVLGLLICFIPMLIIGLSVKLNSEGPVFFKQKRLGLNGKSFYLIKFRSMINNAEEESGAKWAEKNDTRITTVGKFLRKTRLDELPQFLNILKGQMSIVGPRPERAIFYEKFSNYIIGFDQRLLVIPGLTGLAQVNGGYDLLPEEKIVYDIEYLKKRSLFLDLQIIFKTVLIVFNNNGAR